MNNTWIVYAVPLVLFSENKKFETALQQEFSLTPDKKLYLKQEARRDFGDIKEDLFSLF